MVEMTSLKLKMFSHPNLLKRSIQMSNQTSLLKWSHYITSLSSLQLYMFSQSTLLMRSLYMTNLTSLQLNMTRESTLKQITTSQSTQSAVPDPRTRTKNNPGGAEECARRDSTALMLIICDIDVQTNLLNYCFVNNSKLYFRKSLKLCNCISYNQSEFAFTHQSLIQLYVKSCKKKKLI